jgi:hypothetical protein
MTQFGDLIRFVERFLADWRSVRLQDLQFWHRADARLLLLALVSGALVILVARTLLRRRDVRHGVMVPAVLAATPQPISRAIVHLPFVLALAGIPFFAIAFADPFTALVSSQEAFPGRRIAIMIDASISMRTPFTAETLNKRAKTDATFFTTVAAAERFVELRMAGKYRDLIGLVEFGNQAYVVMPFTSDYENVLLSISLIGDPLEFNAFPDQGTVIAQAIDESIELYRAFDFLDASGNLMVMFTDGEDTRQEGRERNLDDILQRAIDAKIPVYLVRTNFAQEEGQLIPDELWRAAVLKTGGRFYAASDESTLLRAIEDIDRVATGSIQVKQYSRQEPRFAVFTTIAALLWTLASALKLGVPYFQRLA